MVRVSFTANLRRHVDCPPLDVHGDTVAECLDAYFAEHPGVRTYVRDDQGRIRRHVVVFVGRDQLSDPVAQSDPVPPDAEILVMQALSGG